MTMFQEKIRVIPNFPKKGIMFQDITTLLKDTQAFAEVIDLLFEKFKNYNLLYIIKYITSILHFSKLKFTF